MTGRMVFEWMAATVLVVGLGIWAVGTAGNQVEKAAAKLGSDLNRIEVNLGF